MNEKFGLLTIVKEVERLRLPCGQTNRAFLCKCDCGNEAVVRKSHLFNGRTTSCGCRGKGINGECLTPIYKVWNSIKTRTKPNYFKSKDYYDKGVRVCDEWLNSYQEFKKFALANGFKKGLTIDRIDSNGNYEPSNVRFVTPKVNCNNRGNTFMVEYQGKKHSLRLLHEELKLKIPIATIYTRIVKGGYTFEEAITKPIGNNYKGRFKGSSK
jgi:hypothetical protein